MVIKNTGGYRQLNLSAQIFHETKLKQNRFISVLGLFSCAYSFSLFTGHSQNRKN